jgi:hypothetical protein
MLKGIYDENIVLYIIYTSRLIQYVLIYEHANIFSEKYGTSKIGNKILKTSLNGK